MGVFEGEYKNGVMIDRGKFTYERCMKGNTVKERNGVLANTLAEMGSSFMENGKTTKCTAKEFAVTKMGVYTRADS